VVDWRVEVGDCIEVMRGLDAGSVDAVVTSPPYAMQRAKQYGGIPDADYPAWTVAWMAEAHRLLVPSGSVIINIREHVKDGQISDYVHHTRLALREWGWFEWDELIWIKKTSAPIGHPSRPRRSWERLLWFGKSRQGFAAPKANGSPSESVGRSVSKAISGGYQGRVTGQINPGIARCRDYIVCNPEHNQNHPAPYPAELAEWCINLTCPFGGTVLDPFTGSGTTGMVAVRNGRNFVGSELNPEYADMARGRMAGAVPITA
jgi:site-specific DNA-methyltransferase (adenine-specific)